MAQITNDDGILRFECTTDKYGARPKNEDGALASIPLHDNGHVSLLATYGSDQLIVEIGRAHV